MTAHQIAPRPISTEKAERDKDYLKWLRNRPCDCGCNRRKRGRMHSHHTGSVGMGKGVKATDIHAITLFDLCHRRAHDIGEKAFAKEKGLDIPSLRARVYASYLAQKESRKPRDLREGAA